MKYISKKENKIKQSEAKSEGHMSLLLVGKCVLQVYGEVSHRSKRRGRGKRRKLESAIRFDPLLSLAFLQGQEESNQKIACSPQSPVPRVNAQTVR